ncbi:MAG: glycosyltransferase, partial [Prevotellaceae bacterium]|nr:glycosyltransferase [Prevotellaceae bacterium]
MNILLFSHVEVSAIPTAGGIQRVTQLLANAFINECGYNCYHAFYYANSKDDAKINFKDKIQLSWGKEYKDLSDFLLKNKIDLILFQNILGDGEALLQQLRRAADDVNAKIILCLHVAPDSCLAKPNASAEFYRLVGGILPKKSITKLTTALFPRLLFNKLAKWQTKKTFSQYNRYFDKIVLLSESFIDTYCEFSDISAEMKNKITAIPNPLTFSEYINPQEFDKKQKEVLILSRMSERQKRVSDALKIWQQVQNKTDISDWKLVIVGGGEDTEWLKNKAKKLKLTNYSFEGVQNPLAYYKRA